MTGLIFGVIAGILLLVLLGSYGVYRVAFHSPNPRVQATTDTPEGVTHSTDGEGTRQRIRTLYTLPHEDVYIRSFDGLRLRARVYEGDPGKPVTICFHGYRGAAARDMSGGANIVLSQGHTVLLVDERAHMLSDGHSITYGIRERYDVLSWVEYAIDRYGDNVRINLMGISMGAATVLMSASLPLPPNVRAISADCPFNDVRDIIRYVGRRQHYPVWLAYPLMMIGAFLFAHINPGAITAADAVRHTQIPIIIIHGEADTLVPAYMSEEIRAANPDMIERYTFPGAEHGLSFIVDEKRYVDTYLDFLSRHHMLQ